MQCRYLLCWPHRTHAPGRQQLLNTPQRNPSTHKPREDPITVLRYTTPQHINLAHSKHPREGGSNGSRAETELTQRPAPVHDVHAGKDATSAPKANATREAQSNKRKQSSATPIHISSHDTLTPQRERATFSSLIA